MLPRSSAGNSAVLHFHFWWEKNSKCLWQYIARLVLFFYFFILKSQIDATSVQAVHAGSSYASEVYSSGAVERANEGIKKKKDLIVRT